VTATPLGGPVASPRFVLASAGDATTVLRRLVRQGWTAREGYALPEAQWDVSAVRLVLHGRVQDTDTAQFAVLAAARGAGVVVVTDLDTDIGRAVLADLRRIGPVATGPELADPPSSARPGGGSGPGAGVPVMGVGGLAGGRGGGSSGTPGGGAPAGSGGRGGGVGRPDEPSGGPPGGPLTA